MRNLFSKRAAVPAGPVEFLIVGLGNPGKEYENTRHNAGFAALEALAEKLDVRVDRIRFKSFCGEGRIGDKKVLLLMPQNCPDGVESVIRRVQNAVQAARVSSHPELRLSVSIGGVCNVQPLTEAIRQADARMYCNKENGEPVL